MEKCENVRVGTEARRSQVREQMDIVNAATMSTGDSLRELKERLEPVLRHEIACKSGEESPQRELVPVANELRDMHERAAGNNAIVIDILDRLEL